MHFTSVAHHDTLFALHWPMHHASWTFHVVTRKHSRLYQIRVAQIQCDAIHSLPNVLAPPRINLTKVLWYWLLAPTPYHLWMQPFPICNATLLSTITIQLNIFCIYSRIDIIFRLRMPSFQDVSTVHIGEKSRSVGFLLESTRSSRRRWGFFCLLSERALVGRGSMEKEGRERKEGAKTFWRCASKWEFMLCPTRNLK